MDAPVTLPEIEAALRGLIAGEAFEDAARLLDDFAAAAEREVVRASGDPAGLLAIRARVADFFDWAEARTMAQRSCASAEAVRLKSLGCYDASAPFARATATA